MHLRKSERGVRVRAGRTNARRTSIRTTENHISASGDTPNVTKHSAFSSSPSTPTHASMASRVSRSVTISASARRTSLDITPVCSASTRSPDATQADSSGRVSRLGLETDRPISPRTRSLIKSTISDSSNLSPLSSRLVSPLSVQLRTLLSTSRHAPGPEPTNDFVYTRDARVFDPTRARFVRIEIMCRLDYGMVEPLILRFVLLALLTRVVVCLRPEDAGLQSTCTRSWNSPDRLRSSQPSTAFQTRTRHLL